MARSVGSKALAPMLVSVAGRERLVSAGVRQKATLPMEVVPGASVTLLRALQFWKQPTGTSVTPAGKAKAVRPLSLKAA